MAPQNKHLKRAESAKKESKYIDFKEGIDINQPGDWCEIIKDIVAMANSGGGVILIGVKDDGKKSNQNIKPILSFDSAKITDKINKYTGIQFGDFQILELLRGSYKTAAVIIESTYPPMIFTNSGNYVGLNGKEKFAFTKGTLYVRHGAKSEPATSADLETILEREMEKRKESWLSNVKKVMEAPSDHLVHILPQNVKVSTTESATPVRLTNDSSAPKVQLVDPDEIYKYRRKEVIDEINKKIKDHTVNSRDIQTVVFAHDISSNGNYLYKPTYSSPQYSEAFIDWVCNQYEIDGDFFQKARIKYSEASKKK